MEQRKRYSINSPKENGRAMWVFAVLLFFLFAPLGVSGEQNIDLHSFDGIDASQVRVAGFDVDPNGAVGTKQYLEWVNTAYQGYDKKTLAPVYSSPRNGDTPFIANGLPQCAGNEGDGVIIFDHLASRWVLARRFDKGSSRYCISVSSTDDLTAKSFSWRAYQLPLDSLMGQSAKGHRLIPDYPKIATWGDAYYVSFNLTDPDRFYREVAILVCAFDRANMLSGAAMRTPQCFRYPVTSGPPFRAHTLLPADVDGINPPPVGAPESFVSIQNPESPDGSSSLNLWTLHVDWNTPENSKFIGPTPLAVSAYVPGCYMQKNPANTLCIPEPSSSSTRNYLDSVGDRLMHRFAYRRFLETSPRESYLIAQTVQVGKAERSETTIRWYELGSTGKLVASGTIAGQDGTYRFMPSIAQDKDGNAAAGYSVSGATIHPSIRAAYWQLPSGNPTEFHILDSDGDQQNSPRWGDYTSMTVDPVDDCTFWYVNEYYKNQTGKKVSWRTRISRFKVPTCR
jgi:hypothetical protein